MTTILILNAVLAVAIFTVIVGMAAWAIRTARPSVVAPAPAHNPRVREHAARARAAHADRAHAARRSAAPLGAQA